ncbi:MAG TPA: flagellar hook capping FlgD N-terminal domain-containing protein [Verrucomicrobiae bacterium]|jgi:flagellar basal-body rod modification protein FlgD|nr:flagellar hook capping FlgD N-terminal domain-containing protein [Verrucomicrobiae bacterium]
MADLTIGGVSSATNSAATAESRIPVQTLGQNDFLQLLVTQMSAQDPLNPQSDTEFISQMAQFSALENSKSLTTEMQTMRANQLLGQTVQVKLDDTHFASGVVSAVDNQTGQPQVIVNGSYYSLSDIIRVQPTAAAPTKSTTTTVPHYAT